MVYRGTYIYNHSLKIWALYCIVSRFHYDLKNRKKEIVTKKEKKKKEGKEKETFCWKNIKPSTGGLPSRDCHFAVSGLCEL